MEEWGYWGLGKIGNWRNTDLGLETCNSKGEWGGVNAGNTWEIPCGGGKRAVRLSKTGHFQKKKM